MKFGRNLKKIVALSDPEWGPYWMNYNYLKKKIKREIKVEVNRGKPSESSNGTTGNPNATIDRLLKSTAEVDFFRILREELKKTSDFFVSAEEIFRIRHTRVQAAFLLLKSNPMGYDKNTWTRLLTACVKFYRDVLMMENFAIMNYCGFSKILKKHDKATGFTTRDAFMRNVMSLQNITHYPYIAELLRESERLFTEIQQMDNCMPLQEEELLFIDAIRELNRQASKVQDNEDSNKESSSTSSSSSSSGGGTFGSSNPAGNDKNHGGEDGIKENGGNTNGPMEEEDSFDEMALHNAAMAAIQAAHKISNSANNSIKSMESKSSSSGTQRVLLSSSSSSLSNVDQQLPNISSAAMTTDETIPACIIHGDRDNEEQQQMEVDEQIEASSSSSSSSSSSLNKTNGDMTDECSATSNVATTTSTSTTTKSSTSTTKTKEKAVKNTGKGVKNRLPPEPQEEMTKTEAAGVGTAETNTRPRSKRLRNI